MPASVLELRPGHAKAKIEERRRSELDVPAAERLPAPAYLSVQAKALWRAHVPRMLEETPDLVADRDIPALGLLFEHVATAQAAARSLRKAGGHVDVLDVDQAHAGRIRKRPGTEVLRTHSQAALGLMREFGMTPSSRVGLRLGPMSAPDDDVDDEAGIFDA